MVSPDPPQRRQHLARDRTTSRSPRPAPHAFARPPEPPPRDRPATRAPAGPPNVAARRRTPSHSAYDPASRPPRPNDFAKPSSGSARLRLPARASAAQSPGRTTSRRPAERRRTPANAFARRVRPRKTSRDVASPPPAIASPDLRRHLTRPCQASTSLRSSSRSASTLRRPHARYLQTYPPFSLAG